MICSPVSVRQEPRKPGSLFVGNCCWLRFPADVPEVFFFNDTATTEIYTLSLHDALPISPLIRGCNHLRGRGSGEAPATVGPRGRARTRFCRRMFRKMTRQAPSHHGAPPTHVVQLRNRNRSEEHTSELQSRQYLVCRLLLE